jgi:hypothetical protein
MPDGTPKLDISPALRDESVEETTLRRCRRTFVALENTLGTNGTAEFQKAVCKYMVNEIDKVLDNPDGLA